MTHQLQPEPLVLIERQGDRVDIVLNRPERKNAITAALAAELRDAVNTVGSDPTVGCIVLRGAGGAFCSGMDLKAAGPDLAAEPIDAWLGVHQALNRCDVPIVVALERFAINAGASLAFSADLVVAGEGAFLQVSEIAMGVGAPMCQAWLHLRHPASVGNRVTLIGDRIGAAELLRLGLVTEVVPDDLVKQRAAELADRVAGHPARGRLAVQSIWKSLRGTVDDNYFASLIVKVRE